MVGVGVTVGVKVTVGDGACVGVNVEVGEGVSVEKTVAVRVAVEGLVLVGEGVIVAGATWRHAESKSTLASNPGAVHRLKSMWRQNLFMHCSVGHDSA